MEVDPKYGTGGITSGITQASNATQALGRRAATSAYFAYSETTFHFPP